MSLLLLLDGQSRGVPSYLPGLNQRFLDQRPRYHDSTINSLPILYPEESGTIAIPRAGRCVTFDGVNDYASRADSNLKPTGDWSAFFWIKVNWTATSNDGILGSWDGTGYMVYPYGGIIYVYRDGGSVASGDLATYDDEWVHIGVVVSGTSVKIYVNGSQFGSTGSFIASSQGQSSTPFMIGAYNSGSGTGIAASMRDVRLYGVAKTAGEAAAIYNQHLTPTIIDRTGLLGGWWLEEEASTTHYDWSGNGRDLTATNVTVGTYRATDTGVKYSAADSLGHTVSGSVIIPRNEASPTLDAAGSALGVAAVAYPATMETPCLTVEGTIYIALAHLTGTETVVSSVGTSTVSVAAGRINMTAGTVAKIVLSDGTNLPCCEGPGGSNTNRTVYDVSSNARHGTLTNGTVATIWAARLATTQDHFIGYGGRVASGVAIPGRLTGSLAADGNALTHLPGKHGNPYSKLLPNVWNAPELYNIGYTSSIKLAPTDTVQSTSPADTKFRRTKTDGDDRYFSTREALTSTNKTNAEAYVA